MEDVATRLTILQSPPLLSTGAEDGDGLADLLKPFDANSSTASRLRISAYPIQPHYTTDYLTRFELVDIKM